MEIKGDFLGFEFAGVRSESLGFNRVSGGDRYDEDLQPDIKDITAEVPGMDGEYYFGSTFGTRTFDIDIAFDSMTEYQFRRMRQIFGRKNQGELIFDERPYKKYIAKIESPIQLSYICFDEPKYTWEKVQTGYNTYLQGISGDYEHKVYDGTTQRIYKGEGKISFICYFPFAKSVYKQLPVTEEESDWVISSGILTAAVRNERNIDTYSNGAFNVYNAGDVPTGFRLYIPGALSNQLTLTYNITGAQLKVNPYTLKTGDVGVIINTDNQLIQGVSSAPIMNQSGNYSYTTSGTIYNEYVENGYFFKLEPNLQGATSKITVTNGKSGMLIFYDYLYF